MTVYVDADACPVREEALRVAARHNVPLIYVSNGGIRPVTHPLVENIIVDQGADLADQWIAERSGPGDLVITSDILLADEAIKTGAIAISPAGEIFTAANIGNILATRDLMKDIRAADPFHKSGGRPYSKADRSRFLQALDEQLRKIGK